MAIPPSTAAPAILAARPISIAFAEAAEALASFGFGSRRAGGIEHLRPPLRGHRSGTIAELLRLEREQLIARLCRLAGAGRGLARGHQSSEERLVGKAGVSTCRSRWSAAR